MNHTLAQTFKHGTKVIGAVVISTALVTGCTGSPAAQPAASSTAEPQLKTVKVSKIEKKKIGEPLEQVADVISSIQLDIVNKAGGDVQEILKKRGDMVEKGEVLFRLDPTDVRLEKEKAQINLNSTQQQMVKAREDLANNKQELRNGIAKLEQSIKDTEKNYAKLRNDYDLGLASKIQLEQMETTLSNMKLDLETSRSKLKTLENTNSLAQMEQSLQTSTVTIRESDRTLNHMEVKAPVSGVLTELPIEVGMTLPAGFKAAMVQQLDPIKIKAELTEESAKLVRGKTELAFYVPGTTDKAKGTVSYLADVMSSQSKSYVLELEVPNADRKLRPGMKAQVLLTEESDQQVITVPTLSVVREGGDTFVYVLVGDQAEKRKVEMGRLNETNQEVISGVKEGEQLIVYGQNQLKDKEKVQLAK
ncbi:Multidrug resistance protein MdtA [Paenibacillus solanacearum]|uniref:Multidrug resistance protein MdtA n=1 Tax=Paenibacillus solanacearum TaxID=2048548 RepID=A0A916JW71_9BACL|nr:efflux RND transporter periplasmic adaptor subunit [Paenibacillus solanacearum]CAG7605058.1 Multidrug resistance protein MdtA [Paenibacillus solanacearum]